MNRREMFVGTAAMAVLATACSTRATLPAQAPAPPPTPPTTGYAPRAIHFDATSTLNILSALATAAGPVSDTPTMTWSFWIRSIPKSSTRLNTSATSFITEMMSTLIPPVITTSYEGEQGHNFFYDNPSGRYGTARINLGTALADGTANNPNTCNYVVQTPSQSTEWTHYLIVFNGSFPGISKRMAVYVNGVKQGAGGANVGAGGSTGPFLINVSNSRGWTMGNHSIDDTAFGTFDIAEVFIDYASDAGIDASNNVSAATLAKFIDANGKPVSLGADGSAPFGHKPHMYWSGPAATFATNKGSVNNAVTSANLYDASFGPGPVPAHKVLHMGTYGDAVPSGIGPFTTSDCGISIKQGDIIVFFAQILDQSGYVNHNVQMPPGFTLLAQASYPSTLASTAIGWKKAAADGESTALPFNWLGTSTRTGNYTYSVFRGADPVSPIDACSLVASTVASTSYPCPSVTPASGSANDLLFNGVASWNAGNFTAPSGSTRCYTHANPALVHHWEYLSSAAATGVRNVVSLGNGGSPISDVGHQFSLLIKAA